MQVKPEFVEIQVPEERITRQGEQREIQAMLVLRESLGRMVFQEVLENQEDVVLMVDGVSVGRLVLLEGLEKTVSQGNLESVAQEEPEDQLEHLESRERMVIQDQEVQEDPRDHLEKRVDEVLLVARVNLETQDPQELWAQLDHEGNLEKMARMDLADLVRKEKRVMKGFLDILVQREQLESPEPKEDQGAKEIVDKEELLVLLVTLDRRGRLVTLDLMVIKDRVDRVWSNRLSATWSKRSEITVRAAMDRASVLCTPPSWPLLWTGRVITVLPSTLRGRRCTTCWVV